jgi:hypothetical protein
VANSRYSYLRALSTLGGLALVGVAAFLNVNHAAQTEGLASPICIAIVALAFGSALAVPVMLTLSRSGCKGLALLALLGLVSSESYGFQLSAERMLSARQTRAQQTMLSGGPYAQAKEALDLSIQERKAECATGFKARCSKLREIEDQKRAALAATLPPSSHTLVADLTGLPAWLVEMVAAMAFSTGLLVLGFVLIGFGSHGATEAQTADDPAVPDRMPDENERVVSWVKEFRRRHGRSPKIPEVQAVFKHLPKTTAWRRATS